MDVLQHIPLLRDESKHRGRRAVPPVVDSSRQYEKLVFGKRRGMLRMTLVVRRLGDPGCEKGQERVLGLEGKRKDPW